MSELDPGAIAVIGMAGRFPGAPSVAELWSNLRAGVESIRSLDDDELRAAGVSEALLSDPNYVKAGAFLEDPDLFDAAFFDVSPREAELMDPQQRIFLECAWEAFEDAGYDVSRFDGRIGVFAGAGKNHYFVQNLLRNPRVLEAMGPVAATIASEKDFVATRVSYKLDLCGPSVSVQTACSTSLVAIHLACQSLLGGECDMVLAGGASVSAYARTGYLFVDGGIFAPDGHLRAFDANAGGQVGGNGAAAVVLKRLSDAVHDGDAIRAVIKGSAVNNDGVQKVSFNAPGVEGQARVVAEALEVAGVESDSIGYVECHGTGTHLGDPIEVAALTQAFESSTKRRGFCGIGSLKTNVGHLDAAAGAAGLIKTVLALENEELPASLNFETPNPALKLETSPFYVNAERRAWPSGSAPRRAGVSSFGMGGTNAHAILEEAPEPAPTSPTQRAQLLVLSARGPAALDATSERLAVHLEGAGRAQSLADVAYTTQVGRKAFRHRRAIVCRTAEEAVARLRARGGARAAIDESAREKGRGVAFLFSGQGTQYVNMARGLYGSEPVFRTELDRCAELLEGFMGLDLREVIFAAAGDTTPDAEAEARLELTQHTQPALFVVEYALAKLLGSIGIEPAAMLGHSIGEYVAACLAGVFSLEDALRLVAARGRLIGSLPSGESGGAMLAIPLAESAAEAFLPDGVSIAVVNAPELVVAAGPVAAIDELRRALRAKKIAARPLRTSHAFHSALMDPILEAFEREVRSVKLNAPSTPIVSCSTGTWLSAEEATDAAYWVKHLRDTVRFSAGVETLGARVDVLLEVGPGTTLKSLAGLTSPDATVIATTRHPSTDADDDETLRAAVGALWCEGVRVDWARFHAGETRRRAVLPTYPFERRRFWIEPADDRSGGGRAAVRCADPAQWFWTSTWHRGARPQTHREPPPHVLLVGAPGGLTDALARAWRAAGAGGVATSVDPLADGALGSCPSGTLVVHLFATEPLRDRAAEDPDELDERFFFSALALAQALGERAIEGAQFELALVSAGMQNVFDDLVDPEKALLLGVCKAVNAELEGVRCRAIDVALGDDAEARAAVLVSELTADDPIVALRGGFRWIADVERVRLEATPSVTNASIPSPHPPRGDAERDSRGAWRLRQNPVILITGGLGGMGLALAEGFARHAQARLALLGRTGLSAPDERDAGSAEHAADDRTRRRLEAVRRIEALGSEVLVIEADVTIAEDVEAAVARVRDRFGAIHGVVHAAGLPGAGLLQLKSRAEAASVLAPKVRGTRWLAAALDEDPLDFFVLCSSLATALDGVGQVDYFAANAFLDAFALSRSREPRSHFVAIGWEAWREVGMAADGERSGLPESLQSGREESLRLGLTSEEGWDVLARILDSSLAQVHVSTRDLRARIRTQRDEVRTVASGGDDNGGAGALASESVAHERPDLDTEFVEAKSATEREVTSIWADLLGIERVGTSDDFFELGGNSLLLMQVSVRLRSAFDVTLSMRELFETPTAASLAERVDSMRLLDDVNESTDAVASETEEFRL